MDGTRKDHLKVTRVWGSPDWERHRSPVLSCWRLLQMWDHILEKLQKSRKSMWPLVVGEGDEKQRGKLHGARESLPLLPTPHEDQSYSRPIQHFSQLTPPDSFVLAALLFTGDRDSILGTSLNDTHHTEGTLASPVRSAHSQWPAPLRLIYSLLSLWLCRFHKTCIFHYTGPSVDTLDYPTSSVAEPRETWLIQICSDTYTWATKPKHSDANKFVISHRHG